MEELEKFLEKELNGLALKKADWGHLTIEDGSRERTLLEVQELVKKLYIHNVSDLLIAWEQFKEFNWWESDAVDVEKVLMDKFQAIYVR